MPKINRYITRVISLRNIIICSTIIFVSLWIKAEFINLTVGDIPDPTDSSISTTEIAEIAKSAPRAMGEAEELFAEGHLRAAESIKIKADEALKSGAEENARSYYAESMSLFKTAEISAKNITGERHLLFPKDHSIGEIWVRTWGNKNKFKLLGNATGELTVAPELEVQLSIRPDFTDADLTTVSELEPGAIQYLTFSSDGKPTNLKDHHISTILKITGLKAISLYDTGITDKGLNELSKMQQLDHINLMDTNVSSKGVQSLFDMPALRDFAIEAEDVTGSIMTTVKTFTQLHTLIMRETPITDDELKNIVNIRYLEKLWISGHQLTDESIKSLLKMSQLRDLTIFKSNLSDEVVIELKRSLPECEIHVSRN